MWFAETYFANIFTWDGVVTWPKCGGGEIYFLKIFQKQNWNHTDVNKMPISVVLHRKSLFSRWGLGIFIMPEASLKHQHFFHWIQSLLSVFLPLTVQNKSKKVIKKKMRIIFKKALWYALEILDLKSISSGLQSQLSSVV